MERPEDVLVIDPSWSVHSLNFVCAVAVRVDTFRPTVFGSNANATPVFTMNVKVSAMCFCSGAWQEVYLPLGGADFCFIA